MKILFLESVSGRYDELKYATCVAKKYASELRKKGHEVIEIERPSPKQANEAIKKYKPDVVWWVGHGSKDRATLEKIKLWISTTHNLQILKDTIAVAHACFTGLQLGPKAVKTGATAYLGYTKELWFQWCNDPEYYNCACSGKNPYGIRPEVWKKILISSHVGTLTFIKSLAEGKDLKTAFDDSIKAFEKYEDELKKIKPSNQSEASIIRVQLWALDNNKGAQVLYIRKTGEKAEVKTSNKIRPLKSLMIFGLMSLPVLGLAYVGGESHAEKLPNI